MEDETWSLGQKLISVSSWAVGLRAELIVAWTGQGLVSWFWWSRGKPGVGVVHFWLSRDVVEVCPPLATGFRVVTSRFGFCPSSSRGWLAIVRGRRFGSGFKTMCDGMPP